MEKLSWKSCHGKAVMEKLLYIYEESCGHVWVWGVVYRMAFEAELCGILSGIFHRIHGKVREHVCLVKWYIKRERTVVRKLAIGTYHRFAVRLSSLHFSSSA
jgi:hypothetical protein